MVLRDSKIGGLHSSFQLHQSVLTERSILLSLQVSLKSEKITEIFSIFLIHIRASTQSVCTSSTNCNFKHVNPYLSMDTSELPKSLNHNLLKILTIFKLDNKSLAFHEIWIFVTSFKTYRPIIPNLIHKIAVQNVNTMRSNLISSSHICLGVQNVLILCSFPPPSIQSSYLDHFAGRSCTTRPQIRPPNLRDIKQRTKRSQCYI